jgi:SAM-dependent methyltransferase
MTGPDEGDAFGQALLDRLSGDSAKPVMVERDDGMVDVDTFDYLAAWDDQAAWALDRARGRVLDVGAGAGRASLAVQDRGQEVVALDTSPGAVQACRRRGVREVFLGTVEELAASQPQAFDSILMLGNNLGLLASPDRAGDLLRTLGTLLRPGGIIAGTCLDPYQTTEQAHLAYHQRNRRRGRMPGQVTIRVRYQQLATPWFDLLWLSPAELAELTASAGWQLAETLPGAIYSATLTRT